ncbi:hypothetical protein ACFV29_32645 [Streptomyces sp. NPDC059690]
MTKPTAQNAPVASAVTNRAAKATVKELVRAATTWPAAKTDSAARG